MSIKNLWWQRSVSGPSVEEPEDRYFERLADGSIMNEDYEDELFEGQPPQRLPEDEGMAFRHAAWL